MPEQPIPHTTIVSFLLDRTGSMDAIKDETIGGFNAYIDALQAEAGDLVVFTLLQFDSQSIDTLSAGPGFLTWSALRRKPISHGHTRH